LNYEGLGHGRQVSPTISRSPTWVGPLNYRGNKHSVLCLPEGNKITQKFKKILLREDGQNQYLIFYNNIVGQVEQKVGLYVNDFNHDQ